MIVVSSLPPPDWLSGHTWAHESAAFDIAESAEVLWLLEPTKSEYLSIVRRRERLGLTTYYSGDNLKFLELINSSPAPTSMEDLGEADELLIIDPDIDPLTDIILGSYSDQEKEQLIESYLEKYPDSSDAAVVLSELNREKLNEMIQRFPDEPRLKAILVSRST